MSQGSQGSFAAGRMVLPLSKFSYATVHGESIIPIPWVHLGRTNKLFAIFESQCVEGSRDQARDVKKFKVLRDPDVLEDIDLDILASEANRAKMEAQDPRADVKLPSVTIIVKIPCVAIRYPLEGGQIRRIQMRFASNDDYYETLKILTRVRVPFGDAGSFPTLQQPARPLSSSSSLLRPSDSASHLCARPELVSLKTGDLPNTCTVASAGWASTDYLRPTTSSGLACGSPSGTVTNYFRRTAPSAGVLHSSGMSFNDTPVMNNPASGLVSGYFAGQNQLHSLQPSTRSALDYVSTHCGIDLYQPRPSTAPAIESQSLSQMLPPKRELPFSNPAPAKKFRKNPTRSERVQADGELSAKTLPPSPLPNFGKWSSPVLDAVSAKENTRETFATSAVIVSATKGKRVAASRTTKPQALKKQQAKVTAKKASKAAKEKEIVPSVEQLLKEADDHSNDAIENSATLDTQVLLSRAEATRLSQSIELPGIPKAPDPWAIFPAPFSQARKCMSCRSRKGKCDGKDPCDWCADLNLDCTYEAPVDSEAQVLVSSSQPGSVAEVPMKASSPVHENVASPPQEVVPKRGGIVSEAAEQEIVTPETHVMQEHPLREPEPLCTPQAEAIDPDATLIDAAPHTPNAGTIPPPADLHLSAHPGPVALLCREAAFAQANQLTSWANLPESVQRSTLDTWMCQQLKDPSFTTLVKRLDESWQANLFGRSVGIDI